MATIQIIDVITRRKRTVPYGNNICTCGTCGRSWDDSIATSLTPAPSARCPFEDLHKEPKPARTVSRGHTRAPWVAEEASNAGEFANIYGARNRPVCAVYIGKPDADEPDAQDMANKALLLAAPDLLNECYRALPFLEDALTDTGYKPGAVAARIKSLRAAIAKAES